MAATYGRLTGRPGVCITTLGPGALNLSTGAAYAHLGAMPMVMITGQKGDHDSRQARFQIVDVVASMKPLTKLSRQIVSAGDDPDAGARCLPRRAGGAARPGASGTAGRHRRRRSASRSPLVPPHPIEMPVAHRAALDRAAEMILAAKRPLIMLGAAASAGRARPPASRSFVLRTGIPFFTTQMGKGTVPGGTEPLHGHGGAVRARLCARGHRRRPI